MLTRNLFRYLLHLGQNPCNSNVHERDKWLLACAMTRGDPGRQGAMFGRVLAQLDTASLVTTFTAGFSFYVVSSPIDFTPGSETIPRVAIVALLGFAFLFR